MNKYMHYDEYLKSGIDFGNTDQLVLDAWLFLTNKPLHEHATIKKEAFIHEITALINAIREYESQTLVPGLSIMSPKQFKEFLERKFKPNNELEQKDIMYECPKCKQQQEHRYPMSGTLYCFACGELLDDISKDDQ